MATIEDILANAQPQSSGNGSVENVLSGAGFTPEQIAQPVAQAQSVQPSSTWQRFKTGFADIPIGIAQGMGHLFGQEKISPQERAAYGVGPNEDVNFDQYVADREKAYQAGRAAAGSTGFDWARTGGNVANPINYLVPGPGAESTALRVLQAGGQGAAVSALQPVDQPGNFWGGKVWQAGTGAIAGLLTGGAIESLAKPLNWAAQKVKGIFGTSPNAAVAAQGAIDQTLSQAGIKATDLPQEFVSGAREQIANGEVRPDVLRAQAEAASLPVPMQLPEALAGSDAAKFSLFVNRSKTAEGAAEGAQLTDLHQKLLANIDALGARGAPSTAEAGTNALTSLAQIDQKLDSAKNAAYAAVRDNQGRSARLDPEAFYMKAEGALERDNSATFLPPDIRNMYEDITEGRLPFTVDTMTNFDKILSRAQRSANIQNGNAAHAIGLVRNALADTPVSSEMGQQAIAAYNTAKGLAKAQFQLADPKSQQFIPGYAAMLKGMGNDSQQDFMAALQGGTANVDPAQWFTKNVMNTTPAAAKKLVTFLQQGGADTTNLQHAAMGAIRDQVVNGDAGREVLSGAALQKVMDRRATLEQFLPSETLNGLQRLANTATRIQRPPPNNSVNWSNTAPAMINLGTAKEAAGTATRAVASLSTLGRTALGVKDVVTDLSKRRAMRAAALEAASPAQVATPASRKVAGYGAVPLATLLAGEKSRE